MKYISYSDATLRVEGNTIFGATILCEGPTVDGRFEFDAAFLDELCAMLAAGAKSNFGHQETGDTASALAGAGRVTNPRRVGNRLVGDLTFYDAARECPLFERDPVAACLAYAGEAPTSFGLSLNMKLVEDEDGKYHPWVVRSIDIVGDPAGCPNGLLSTHFLEKETSAMTTPKPPMPTEPLKNAKLADAPADPPQADPPQADPPADEPAKKTPREELIQELLAMQQAFHDDSFVLEMFLAGKGLAEAQVEWKAREEERLKAQMSEMAETNKQMAAKLSAMEAQLAPRPAGAAPATLTPPHAGDPKAEAKLRWDGDAKLRAEFGRLETFLAYDEAEKAGRCR